MWVAGLTVLRLERLSEAVRDSKWSFRLAALAPSMNTAAMSSTATEGQHGGTDRRNKRRPPLSSSRCCPTKAIVTCKLLSSILWSLSQAKQQADLIENAAYPMKRGKKNKKKIDRRKDTRVMRPRILESHSRTKDFHRTRTRWGTNMSRTPAI